MHLIYFFTNHTFYCSGCFENLQLRDQPYIRYLTTPYYDPQTRDQVKYKIAHNSTNVRIEIILAYIIFACLGLS